MSDRHNPSRTSNNSYGDFNYWDRSYLQYTPSRLKNDSLQNFRSRIPTSSEEYGYFQRQEGGRESRGQSRGPRPYSYSDRPPSRAPAGVKTGIEHIGVKTLLHNTEERAKQEEHDKLYREYLEQRDRANARRRAFAEKEERERMEYEWGGRQRRRQEEDDYTRNGHQEDVRGALGYYNDGHKQDDRNVRGDTARGDTARGNYDKHRSRRDQQEEKTRNGNGGWALSLPPLPKGSLMTSGEGERDVLSYDSVKEVDLLIRLADNSVVTLKSVPFKPYQFNT